MDEDARQRLRAGAAQALGSMPVKFAYLFGSRAREQTRADSDLDVACTWGAGRRTPRG